jgi:glucosylceramidase
MPIKQAYFKWDFLAKAQNVSNPPLRLFSSPWSAPAWIKTNNMMQLGGSLKDGPNSKYALLYAKYFIRFFEEYARKGVNFWATTIQNEPSMSGEVDWQSMEFNTTHQKYNFFDF